MQGLNEMIIMIQGSDIRYNDLMQNMWRDRARCFGNKGWKGVTVDKDGLEKDQFDTPGSIYLIKAGMCPDTHLGSVRLLLTTGPTLADALFPGVAPCAPDIVEASRFCVMYGRDTARELVAAIGELCLREGFSTVLNVVDNAILRMWERLGIESCTLAAAPLYCLASVEITPKLVERVRDAK